MAKRTPELDKLADAIEEYGTPHIGAFLEWLRSEEIVLCRAEDGVGYYPIHTDIERLLMRYVGINPEKIERERRMLLDAQRRLIGSVETARRNR